MAYHQPAQRGVRESFTAFYEDWLIRHQEFQRKLLDSDGKEEECREIVRQVLAHYEEFFNEKWKAASEDVFLVMSSPWLSPLERALMWISAFKPSILFPVMKSSVGMELSADQIEKIEVIKNDTRRKEKELEGELARVHESVAGNDIFGFLRRFERLVDDEISDLETVMEDLKMTMLGVMESADALRQSTAKKIIEVLEPLQNVKLFAAYGEILVQARKRGLQNDS